MTIKCKGKYGYVHWEYLNVCAWKLLNKHTQSKTIIYRNIVAWHFIHSSSCWMMKCNTWGNQRINILECSLNNLMKIRKITNILLPTRDLNLRLVFMVSSIGIYQNYNSFWSCSWKIICFSRFDFRWISVKSKVSTTCWGHSETKLIFVFHMFLIKTINLAMVAWNKNVTSKFLIISYKISSWFSHWVNVRMIYASKWNEIKWITFLVRSFIFYNEINCYLIELFSSR